MREAMRETMQERRPDGEAEFWQMKLRERWLRHIDARTRRSEERGMSR